MANKTKLTDKKREKFLDVVSKTGNVSAAARVIGLARGYMYELRDEDKYFAKEWDSAYQTFLDNLEAALAHRGLTGVLEPVFYQGMICGRVRKFSDTAAIAILNGRRSEIFKSRMEHSGGIEQRVRFTFGKKKAEKKGAAA